MATGSARARRDARGGPAGHGLGADGGGTGAERGRPRADGASGGTRRAAGDGTLGAPAGDGGRARRSPAAGVLPGRAVVLTLSSSEVVYRALLAARRRGRLARVVVAESRPGREGEALARRL